MFIVSAVIVC